MIVILQAPKARAFLGGGWVREHASRNILKNCVV